MNHVHEILYVVVKLLIGHDDACNEVFVAAQLCHALDDVLC